MSSLRRQRAVEFDFPIVRKPFSVDVEQVENEKEQTEQAPKLDNILPKTDCHDQRCGWKEQREVQNQSSNLFFQSLIRHGVVVSINHGGLGDEKTRCVESE